MSTLATQPDPTVAVDHSSTYLLLARKMGVAALVAFLAVFLPGVITILDDVATGDPFTWQTTVWVSLIAAAFGAAVRAVIAVLPFNLVPTDALHGFGKNKPEQVLVEPPK